MDTNSKRKFSEVFPDGVFNIEECDLRKDEKEFLNLLLTNLRWNVAEGFVGDFMPNTKEIYIDYINSDKHNAYASYTDFKAIGINYGLVLNLYKIAILLLNCKDIFEDLPDDKELYAFEEIVPFFQNSFQEIPDLRLRAKPIDEERTIVASMVARIAFYFIVGHEFRHVLSHGGIIQNIYQKKIISEFYDENIFDSDLIFNLRTLEVDADRNGALLSYILAINFYQADESPLYDLYPGPSYVWMMSLLTLLFSFQKASQFYYPEKNSYHPATYIRQSFCLQYIRSILDNPAFVSFFGANYKPDFNVTLVNDYSQLELFFQKLGVEIEESMKSEFQKLVQNLEILQTKF